MEETPVANQMLAEVQKALETAPVEERLALPDVIVTTTACLGLAAIAAVPGWMFLSGSFALYLALIIGLMFFGIYVARRSPVKAPLALVYSAALGLMMGAFSHMAVESGDRYALIVQAIIGTVAGTIGMLVVYSTPWGKKASRAYKLFGALAIGSLVLGLANIVAVLFGVGGGWGFYGVSGIGLVLCAIGVAMAAWSLLMDIGRADMMIQSGAPRSWSWSLGMALCASIVWLYMELLRFLSIANR
jgi:uncharacterized YccA/Bax inhibitor family protein